MDAGQTVWVVREWGGERGEEGREQEEGGRRREGTGGGGEKGEWQGKAEGRGVERK